MSVARGPSLNDRYPAIAAALDADPADDFAVDGEAVAFMEWTADGRLRHPSFLGLRFDKPAREVTREEPASG